MKITHTPLEGVVLLEPRVFEDDRGAFFESFNQKTFETEVTASVQFVQDNHSISSRHVLRGLHYQMIQPQGKLVRAIVGRIFDVAVDIRQDSPTFGQWVGYELSAVNHRQLWVPVGFAHGFLVLSERAEVLYKTTDYYCKEGERAICWNDTSLAISWPLEADPILSAKDAAAPSFLEADYFPADSRNS